MISFFNSLAFLWISKMTPEKKINKYVGFRTKESMKNQRNWDLAQREMIRFSKKLVFPSVVMGCAFLLAEIYFLFIYQSENLFSLLMIMEGIISVFMFAKMYLHVKRSLL
ncbi:MULTISPECIES: SdpI family protein [Enterococcus]|nr:MULTISPECIES: SdpI family protein [Enterococcus]MDQ6110292.1 SdpI family protein [Enterococcus gallinarum]QCT91106.1 SdpI family protein [Enterococcus sp. M190262]GMG58147.1 hypothetical protein AH4_15680 [Enterococcus gallinarum]